MNWADYALDLEERLDAANRGRLALATELAALKARRCNGCAHYTPPTLYDSTLTFDDDTWDVTEMPHSYGRCAITATANTEPTTPTTPMYADDSEGYSAVLRVRPDHACNAWQPITTDQEPTT